MTELLSHLQEFLLAGWNVFISLGALLLPWTPLAAWIGYWMFAVDWVKMRDVLAHRWGWIGLVLIGAVMVLVWGVIAPPTGGYHELPGLKLTNFFGKFVYVSGLFSIMLLCGAVQLSGCCGNWCRFEDDAEELEPHHDAH
jgi:hypothetical protein